MVKDGEWSRVWTWGGTNYNPLGTLMHPVLLERCEATSLDNIHSYSFLVLLF